MTYWLANAIAPRWFVEMHARAILRGIADCLCGLFAPLAFMAER